MAAKRTPRTGGTRAKKKPKPAPGLPAPGMEEFMTRSRANEGHKIPLYTAAGQLTAHWVRVRGVDSDAFRMAVTKQHRRTAEIAQLPDEEREEAIEDAKREMVSSLVIAWSFDKECTLANVKAFLREAPQIAAEIDKFANRRTLFFKMPSDSLTPTLPPSSP